jgi:hypothetical protein
MKVVFKIALTMILLCGHQVSGQVSNFTLGADFGLNRSAYWFISSNSENYLTSSGKITLDYYTDRVQIGISCSFNNMGYREYQNYITPDQNSKDPFIPDVILSRYNYLSLPLNIGYEILDGEKVRIASQVGFGLNFNMYNQEKTYFLDGHFEKSEIILDDVIPLFISIPFSISTEYKLTDKIGINGTIYTSYIPNKISSQYSSERSFYSGVYIGISYHI